ncbi:MAG: DUF5615 family PIN-like protein [Gemmataceae bacterium]|nr:DUF5615 family PIN-like protein [Gemmataceae bacterium]MCI0737616.1 DUF5615 family PIN-like protein [Gemmataceae bacterium]
MRFKVDENLPVETADLLRKQQWDALTVPEQQMAGQLDEKIAEVCKKETRALITLDLDFSNIRHYPPEEYQGIIVLRPTLQSIPALLRLIAAVIDLLSKESLACHLWIVDDHQIRIRGESSKTE